MTAPIPVMATRRVIAGAGSQVDHVLDGRDLLHLGVADLDAVLVLDHLRELDQVERVDVQVLEASSLGLTFSGSSPNSTSAQITLSVT